MDTIDMIRERNKVLCRKADCVDLFELKEEILRANYFKFKTASLCMFPVLKKDDILKVEPVRVEDIKIGDIPIYRNGNNLYAHRIVDKRIIDGKEYIITRADTSTRDESPIKDGEEVSPENLLGRIVEVKRGRKIFSTEKRKATPRERFLYHLTKLSLDTKKRARNFLEIILTKIQSFKIYQALGKKITKKIMPYLNFELAIPISNRAFRHVYKYMSLKEDKILDFSEIEHARIFHIIMKFKNIVIGCASFININKSYSSSDNGFWMSEVYIRFRYKKIGFEAILEKKARNEKEK